ncbi:hypothetical protein ACFYKX_26460 [Cytobacillus sp. FJAT-54145]|uniref:Uncharacterized protein n=1 Tax=Cytobacillus spartinae TaxID=3299023 RepID=A0ABW6KMQ0_9BACI
MNRILINDLIDEHGETFTTCKGCKICRKIHSLTEERTPEEKYKNILAKGQDMTKSEIDFLLENEVQKRSIQKALNMDSKAFYQMMEKWGFSKRRVGPVAKLTKEEYQDLKAQGITDKEIAKQKGIASAYVSQLKRKWFNSLEESKTTEKITSKGKTPKKDKTAEFRDLINELSDKLNEANKDAVEKDKLVKKLEAKIQEFEGINSACEDVENELDSLRTEKDNYLNQLLDTRDQLVRKDYELENNKKSLESVNKVLKRLTKENEVLRDLAKANAMVQLEIL